MKNVFSYQRSYLSFFKVFPIETQICLVIFMLDQLSHFLQQVVMSAYRINPWTVLTTSPFTLYNRHEQIESFHEMIISMLAPYYKIKSLTTVLVFLPIIIYITLVIHYPPFLRIPSFASQPLELRPEHLQHYEFYRLFTSPFVFTELSTLAIGCLIIWSLGSFTQQFLGWRMLIVFSGFQGLIGYSYSLSLACFLIGCNFSYVLMTWADREHSMVYRKITLVLYMIVGLMYILFFINFSKDQKYSSYLSTLYGMVMTYMVGTAKDSNELATYRKISLLACFIIFVTITSLLILNIVLYRYTIV